MAFEITHKGWIWIYAILVVLIISVLLVKVTKAGTGKKPINPDATVTDCCGELTDCYGLSFDQIKELQKELNDNGCKDFKGNELDVDGLCGPLTNSAIVNCRQ